MTPPAILPEQILVLLELRWPKRFRRILPIPRLLFLPKPLEEFPLFV
jgi:hypothetical protein